MTQLNDISDEEFQKALEQTLTIEPDWRVGA